MWDELLTNQRILGKLWTKNVQNILEGGKYEYRILKWGECCLLADNLHSYIRKNLKSHIL
jgi:hypothetical protein